MIAAAKAFFAVAVLLNRYGDTIRAEVENGLGLSGGGVVIVLVLDLRRISNDRSRPGRLCREGGFGFTSMS